MIQYPGFDKIAFEIGPFGDWGSLKVHWYGIMYLVAFAAAWWLGRVRAKKPGSTWKPVDIDDFMFFGMLGTILGGRLGYVLFYGLSFWAEDKWYPFKVWDGGMSFHGGLLGVLIAFAVYAVRRDRRIADVFDFAAPLPGIGICAVRIGNFINGELWGKPTDVPWGFMVDGTVRHATQLYEAVLEGVVLFAILWWMFWKTQARYEPGKLVGAFLFFYGLFRFGIEFIREPDQQLAAFAQATHLHMGQWLSLPMILGGLWLMWTAKKRRVRVEPTVGSASVA